MIGASFATFRSDRRFLLRIEINQKIVGKEEYVNGEGVTGGTASMSENRRSANGCKAGQGRAGQGRARGEGGGVKGTS